jgi:hypothetical protein
MENLEEKILNCLRYFKPFNNLSISLSVSDIKTNIGYMSPYNTEVQEILDSLVSKGLVATNGIYYRWIDPVELVRKKNAVARS